MGLRITGLERGPQSLKLTWQDGSQGEFHHIWLRDNCRCRDCFHPQTMERLFDLLSVPEDVRPAQAEVTPAGDLRIAWDNDGHVSLFPTAWLRENCYAGDVAIESVDRVLWDGSRTSDLPEADYGAVCSDDARFLDLLSELRAWGAALLRNVPIDQDEALRFVARIGPVRSTNFGPAWNVVSIPKPNSNAYTDLPLNSHTDLPNWEVPPGYQLLHCLTNEVEGGESVLVDGFRVAEELRARHPDSFGLLTQIPFDYRFRDEDTDIHYRAPAIRLGPDGKVSEVRFSIAVMGTLNVPGHLMTSVYRAHRRFAEMLRERAGEIRFRLAPGDMIVFDNRRILHGRTGFDAATGHRHLRGTYVDHDVVDSRIRVLQHALEGAAAAHG